MAGPLDSLRDTPARLEARLEHVHAEFEVLADSRSGNENTRDEVSTC